MEILAFKILFAFKIILFTSHICQSHECLTEPKCYCTTTKTGNIKILCKNVVEVQPINDVLKNYTHVYSLRIYGHYLKSLPSKCFENQSIGILEISSPLESMAEDALKSIKSLEIVNLNGTRFTAIPKGATLPDFRILEMTNGDLQSIDGQLQKMTTTADFLFSNNKISYIAENAFESTAALTNLDLSHNSLTFLNTTIFRNAHNLQSLNLAYNKLSNVDGVFEELELQTLNLYGNYLTNVEGAFNRGLFTLKWLDIGGNPNLNISGSTFRMLRKLTTLSLNNNHFETLDPHLIKNLSYLQNLYLNANNFSCIPKDFFLGSKYIKNIKLSNNNIESMRNLLSFSTPTELHNLKYIALDGNGISSVNISDNFQHILHIDLSRNRLTSIKRMDFMNLKSVTSMNLSRNPLTDIEVGSFAKQQKLKSLDLSFTKIKTLNQSMVNLSSLNYLRIQSSSLQTLDYEFKGLKNLKYVFLDGNSITSVKNVFSDSTNLTYLNLARNNLTTLLNGSLPVNKLKSYNLEKLWLSENPWSCDCRLLWMLEFLKNNHSKLQDEPRCQSPFNLRGISMRDLNKTMLENWKEDCSEGCTCKCIAENASIATIVDCSKRQLKHKPNAFPRNAKSIDVSENKLTFIDFNSTYYPRLEVLNLEGNELREIQVEFSSSITRLYLSRNNLSRIPYENWNNTNLIQMTLSLNPWICDCNTWAFREWLLTYNTSINDLQELKCGDKGRLNNQVIIHLTHGDLCPVISEKDNYIIIIIAIFSVLLLLTCFILYLFRKLLFAICFECGCHCLKKPDYHIYDYDYSFDAFLLFADEDDEFALGVIEEGLEADSRGYKLFVPSRQVLLSSSQLSINSSIADCSKVIVVLSSNFLRNSQCMQLMKTAMACSIDKTAQRFIFIIMDNIPPELKLDAILNCLVKKSICIKWGEYFFWSKLKYNLPKKSKSTIRNEEESERLIQ